MNNPSTLIKGLILPLIIKMSNWNLSNLSDDFWDQFANDFIHYEINAQPIYSTLYKLELQNPEEVFEKLPQAYSSFISELAEEYVLNKKSEIVDKLLETKNEFFLKEVTFLKTMKAVITKLERQDIKKNLPEAYERLVFELDEEILKQVAKKKARENLKAKFKQWDKELVEEEANSEPFQYSIIRESYNSFYTKESLYPANPKRKVISLSWIKYTAAACIVLTAGIMYFKFNTDTNFIAGSSMGDSNASFIEETINPEIPPEALAEVATVTNNATVFESVRGVASNTIKITENNQKARMESIVNAIKYRQLLDKKFSENKVSKSSKVKVSETKINSLQKEFALLKKREKQYNFDGKVLILYVSETVKENSIILYGDNYYLKRDSDFYKLTIAAAPQLYKKISNTNLINKLDLIISETGK